MTLELLPLHTRLDLVQQCVTVLSNEWPIGKYERLEIIESSCPNPPCSLILLSRQSRDVGDYKTDTVIGHARIVPIKDIKDMLFVEQVVIEKTRRGQGLGKRLMELVEEYCVKLGYKTLYLGTSPDTPKLYLRLGYKFTDFRPTMVGSQMLDYTIPVPLSEPYPGWEHYFTPYDGRTLSSTAKIKSDSEPSSQPSTLSLQELTNSKTKVEIPAWALDIDGYCCFIKEIS